MFIDYIDTPIGLLEVMATDLGICQVIFCGQQKKIIQGNEITALGKQQITEYFSGQRHTFNVPLDSHGTQFQQSVWHCLTQIPFGTVKSYGEIAKLLNNPKASQAVGGANGRNPIAIIVPCHRVIGKDGSLTGYAGGIERKLWLLNHEGVKLKKSAEHEQLQINSHKRQAKTQFLR